MPGLVGDRGLADHQLLEGVDLAALLESKGTLPLDLQQPAGEDAELGPLRPAQAPHAHGDALRHELFDHALRLHSLATLPVRALSSPGSSPGSTGVDARRPCRSRLRLALVRPCPVRGPVDFLAFSRLARVRFESVVIANVHKVDTWIRTTITRDHER